MASSGRHTADTMMMIIIQYIIILIIALQSEVVSIFFKFGNRNMALDIGKVVHITY